MDGPDTVAEAGATARRLGITFPIVTDLETQVVSVYNPAARRRSRCGSTARDHHPRARGLLDVRAAPDRGGHREPRAATAEEERDQALEVPSPIGRVQFVGAAGTPSSACGSRRGRGGRRRSSRPGGAARGRTRGPGGARSRWPSATRMIFAAMSLSSGSLMRGWSTRVSAVTASIFSRSSDGVHAGRVLADDPTDLLAELLQGVAHARVGPAAVADGSQRARAGGSPGLAVALELPLRAAVVAVVAAVGLRGAEIPGGAHFAGSVEIAGSAGGHRRGGSPRPRGRAQRRARRRCARRPP
jgi:hypothetical protein